MKELRLALLSILLLCIVSGLFYALFPKYHFPERGCGHIRCNGITGTTERLKDGKWEKIG
jgi:hypothetical protein